jgi:hypothetical protein
VRLTKGATTRFAIQIDIDLCRVLSSFRPLATASTPTTTSAWSMARRRQCRTQMVAARTTSDRANELTCRRLGRTAAFLRCLHRQFTVAAGYRQAGSGVVGAPCSVICLGSVTCYVSRPTASVVSYSMARVERGVVAGRAAEGGWDAGGDWGGVSRIVSGDPRGCGVRYAIRAMLAEGW